MTGAERGKALTGKPLTIRRHASTVSIAGLGSILIEGPSGSGKSMLALHLIERYGAELVSDDQTLLNQLDSGDYMPDCPTEIRGRIEVRGVGLVPYPVAGEPEPVRLVARLGDRDAAQALERLPEVLPVTVIGDRSVPMLPLTMLEFGVPERVLAALRLAVHMHSEG
ncbi:MAG TPA: aldolase [Rhodospirillaceae bacterium]|nr:aldolase [Alphaproteobacteria bacterium]OUT41470.1 MAG: hypothetical protein CBB62_03770 [Micavibrio sp. TMED2]HCI47426.1 aldolase [Rhodospirillaceae bacterium]MAS46980.1 aldolase [Alphaproteobacteria bacterium]MAX95074.1 aldolase [Alphaproteobacteria bacterium]|tara:strand:+ start:11623 stop:12123 length:501 start_codon:yes stop_codon:yes gene_type:complete